MLFLPLDFHRYPLFVAFICLYTLAFTSPTWGQSTNQQINGPDTVCVGELVAFTYTDTTAVLDWSASGPVNYGATDNNLYTVAWQSPGDYVVSLAVWVNGNGPIIFQHYVHVLDAPDPSISASFNSDCGRIIVDSTETREPVYNYQQTKCFTACVGTEVTYYGHGDPGSYLQWIVPSTLNYQNYGDSITVMWDQTGVYTLQLIERNTQGCRDSVAICVEVVSSPVAGINTAPPAVNGIVNICKNQTVFFNSTSTPNGGTPLVSWVWDFGDGYQATGSAVAHKYMVPGLYKVVLKVYNECYCTDTASVWVNVSPYIGVDISCTGMVCPGDTVIYATGALCNPYQWQVQGGTFTTNINNDPINDSIQVIWNNTQNGYGIITLDGSNCNVNCPEPAIAYIPVLSDNLPITGSDTVCSNSQYRYQLPPLQGVSYYWRTIPSGAGIVTPSDSNTFVDVTWFTSGTLIVDYYSTLLGCEGISSLEVTVQDPFAFDTYTRELCVGDTFQTSIAPSGAGTFRWTITNGSGQIVYQQTNSNTGLTLYPWNYGNGRFTLTVEELGQQYCNNSLVRSFTVHPRPPKPVAITGPVYICPNDAASYTAQPTSGNYYLSWTITGGTPATATGNSIGVIWDGQPPYTISVRQYRKDDTGCGGDTLLMAVHTRPTPAPVISGPDTVCVNSRHSYTTQITDAYRYTWAIAPEEMGSVVQGQDRQSVTVQWNNTPGNALLEVTTNVCGVIQTTQYPVSVITGPQAYITAPDSACSQTNISFSTIPGSSYIWDFGDGNTLHTSQNPVQHSYAKDSTYPVQVAIVPQGGCTDTVTATHVIVIQPRPVANLTTPDSLLYCGVRDVTLYASVQGTGSAIYQYTWYRQGQSQPVATGVSTYAPITDGTYFVVVTDNGNGCSDTTNSLTVAKSCGGNCTNGDSLSVSATRIGCRVAEIQGFTGPGARFLQLVVEDPQRGVNTYYQTLSAQHTFSASGHYKVRLEANVANQSPPPDSCIVEVWDTLLIPVYADFTWSYSCDTGNHFRVTITDRSNYVSPHTLTGFAWQLNGQPLTAQQNLERFTLSLPGGQTDTVQLMITSATGYTCTRTYTIAVPDKPKAAFTGPTQTCEGLPVTFTNQSTGNIVDMLWTFGDGASLKKWNGIRAYANSGTPQITLTVTGKYGCTDTAVHHITVNGNPFSNFGGIAATPNSIACKEDTIILTFTHPHPQPNVDEFLWLPTGAVTPTYHATITGRYTLIVTDSNGCWAKYRSPALLFEGPGQPVISGASTYCMGDTIALTAMQGGHLQYYWTVDGAAAPGNNTLPHYNYPATAAGAQEYSVIVTDPATGCSDTSAAFPVVVHTPPDTPMVTSSVIPACGPQLQTLTATASGAVSYRWNTGQQGAVIPVYQSGVYAVNAASAQGCVATGYFIVHDYPTLEGLLSGCYTWCDSSFPRIHPPLPGQYLSYSWYRNGQVIFSGSGTMQPLPIPGGGNYYLTATNTAGCTDTSALLTITSLNCTQTRPIGCQDFNLTGLSVDSCSAARNTYFLTLKYDNQRAYPLRRHNVKVTKGQGSAALQNKYFQPGIHTAPLVFSGSPATDSSLCVAITVYDSIYQQYCTDTICTLLPPCDTASQYGPCPVDIQLDTIYCLQENQNGFMDYTFTLSVSNPTATTYAVLWRGTNGRVHQVDPGMASPGVVTNFSGLFTSSHDTLQQACFTLYLVDTATGAITSCNYCIPLPSCYGAYLCNIDLPELTMQCLGINAKGQGTYKFSFSGINNGIIGQQWFTTKYATLLSYTPRTIGTGPFTISGYLMADTGQRVCLKLLIVDSLGQRCETTACTTAPPCPPTETCDEEGYNVQWQYVSCDSTDPQGRHYVHYGISLNGLPADDYIIAAVSNGGEPPVIVPNPLPAGQTTLTGGGWAIPGSVNPYCVTLMLTQSSTGAVCRMTLCDTLRCPSNKGFIPAKAAEGDKASTLRLKAYPNPVSTSLTIVWVTGRKGNHIMRFTDVQGRDLWEKVVKGEAGTLNLSTNSFAAGMYYLRLLSADGRETITTVVVQ